MCSLPPCCEEEKNVSGDVCPFLPVLLVIFFLFFFLPCIIFYKLYPSLHYLSLPLYSTSKLSLHLLPLCHPLRPSHCPFSSASLSLTLLTNSPQLPAAFEVLTVVTEAGGVWQGSPSKAGPHEYSATPFEWPSPLNAELAADWLFTEPMRAGLSLGQVDMTTEDVGCFTGFSS